MKIMHLSDLHIGKKWFNFDMYKDQKYILDEITDIAVDEKPDAIVIAGDVYNSSSPSADAVELFDYFISGLSRKISDTEIMIISGNHDSTSRINMFREILKTKKIHMIGKPPVKPEDYIEKITLSDEYGNVNFYLLPFISPAMVHRINGKDENGKNFSYNKAVHMIIERENINTAERNVIVSHQFYLPYGTDPKNAERTKSESIKIGNIDVVYADILEKFDYSALGHIHKPMKVGSEFIRYCGTPIAYSVSETNQQKGVIIAELNEKGNIKIKNIPLVPLHEVCVIKGTLDEILAQGCEDYVSAVITEKPEKTDVSGRLNEKFPNLLEIRSEYDKPKSETGVNSKTGAEIDGNKSVFDLCMDFLENISVDEEKILRNIINKVQGGNE